MSNADEDLPVSSPAEEQADHLDVEEDEDDDQPTKRKRSHRESDNEEEEDDDEDRQIRKKMKSSRPGAKFIDDIAVNEDDEDEPDEEEEEEEEEEEDENAEIDLEGLSDEDRKGKKGKKRSALDVRGEDEAMHIALDQERNRMEMEALADQIQNRYIDHGYTDDYDEEGANRASSGAALPSVGDPSLFHLRIGKAWQGKEQDVCNAILQVFYKRELEAERDPSRRLHITSCFTTPASKGYIYIEAFREAHIKQAIDALPIRGMLFHNLANKKKIVVDIAQMVAAIKFNTKQQQVKNKQWVRFKRGPYKDDLAKVVDVQDQGTLLTVKFMPRIDFVYLEAKRRNEKLTRANWKQINPQAAAVRPSQKYFEEREIRSLGFPVERKKLGGHGPDKHKSFYFFLNAKFRGGFQYKEFKIDAFECELVNPLPAEIEKFTQRAVADSDDEEDEADEEARAAEEAEANAHLFTTSSQKPVIYSIGDRVQIIGGALKNVTGRVLSVSKEGLLIQSDLLGMREPIQEMQSLVRKYFTVGSHVKVVTGVYKNETGMICHVGEEGTAMEGKLAIHTDISSRTIEVGSQDVIESNEVSTGRDTFGSYELHDLVQLTNDTVGVVVKIHMASIYVLTNTGSVQQVKLQEIQHKRNDRFSHTPDKWGEAINRDDAVRILSGPERGKQANVKHIFKRTLFCHTREVIDNGGIFVIRGDQTGLVGGSGLTKATAPKSPGAAAKSPGPAPMSPGRSGAAPKFNPTGTFKRDPIIGKDVKITGGPYKGYAGVCLDAPEGQSARVEIRAIFRKVQVPRHQLALAEYAPTRPVMNPYYGGATPLIGGATPSHAGIGSATPHHDPMGGSMTPAHRTPSGGRTPSHDDVWAAQTPAHRSEGRDDNMRENMADEWLQGMGMDSHTAGPTPHPMTPAAVPQTPRTPATALAGASADHIVPQTPATTNNLEDMEDEDEEEEAYAQVAGFFTKKTFIGCHVVVKSTGVNGIVTDVTDRGATVKVKLSTGGRAASFKQSEIEPVQPTNNDTAMVVSESPDMNYTVGQRLQVLSTLNDSALLGNGDLFPIVNLCKCEPAKDEEDDEAETSKSTKKKSKK